MKSIIVFAIFLVGALAAENLQNAQVKIQVVDNIEEFKRMNPDVNLIEMTVDRNLRLRQNWYTIGARKSGDRLVGTDNGWAQYPSKQNLELEIWYPLNGVGAVVTFMQVFITQDDGTFGKGYVVSGGIGQRNIRIIVEAWNTSYVKYDYSIFGI